MSTLFKITIESVAGPTVRAKFEVCHPDQWNVPCNKSVALQTVVEIFKNMQRGIVRCGDECSVIDEDFAVTLTKVHQRRARLEHWVDLYDRAYGMTDNHCDYQPFRSEAADAVLDVRLENESHNPKILEGDPDPKATLVFTMKDASVLFHVVEGFKYESAMCDIEAW